MTRPRIAGRATALGLTIVTFTAMAAMADAIDGDWCFSTQTLNIQGPRIRTPAGTLMDGNYARHSFTYVVPASEPGSGTHIAMQLLNEDVMTLSRGGASDAETWRRCKPIS